MQPFEVIPHKIAGKVLNIFYFPPTTPATRLRREQGKNSIKSRRFRRSSNALRGAGGQCAAAGTWRSLSGFRTR